MKIAMFGSALANKLIAEMSSCRLDWRDSDMFSSPTIRVCLQEEDDYCGDYRMRDGVTIILAKPSPLTTQEKRDIYNDLMTDLGGRLECYNEHFHGFSKEQKKLAKQFVAELLQTFVPGDEVEFATIKMSLAQAEEEIKKEATRRCARNLRR